MKSAGLGKEATVNLSAVSIMSWASGHMGSSVSGMTLKLMGPARKSRGFLRNKFKRCPKPKLGFSHEIVWMILGLR